MEEKMYIQLLELENDDLVESLINQSCTINRYKSNNDDLKSKLEKADNLFTFQTEEHIKSISRIHRHYAKLKIRYDGMVTNLHLKSMTTPLTDNRLIELNKILADKIKVLTEENQYLTNKNNR